MIRINSFVTLFFLTPAFAFSQTWNEKQIINSPQQIYNHEFGVNVAIDGEYGIINADEYAYFIEYDGTQWNISQTINSSATEYPSNGKPIAINGSQAIIGFIDSAIVYQLDDSDGSWHSKQTLEHESQFVNFGHAVSINNEIILVGAPKETISEYQEGTVSIYEYENGKWELVQKIVAEDPTYTAWFGKSVHLEEENVYVGAPYTENGLGAVYHFTKNPTSGQWEQSSKITAEDRINEFFGFDIDVSENRLLVDGGGDYTYLFSYENETWNLVERFFGSAGSSEDVESMAIDGNQLLLGKSGNGGSVEVYELGSDTNWSQSFIMYPSDQHYNDNFGVSVDLDENVSIIGSSVKDRETGRIGTTYIFEGTSVPYALEASDWFSYDIEGRLPQFLDVDNDGDWDLFVSVLEENDKRVDESRIYLNTGTSFEPTSYTFPYVDTDGFAKWTHMNFDDLPDLLIYSQNSSPNFRLYINNGQGFDQKEISFPTFSKYQPYGFHFADYDNDADEDILIQGNTELPNEMRILENNGKFEFEDSGLLFDGYYKSQNPWGDYNADGYIDFLSFSQSNCDDGQIIIYKNQGNKIFEKVSINSQGSLNNDLLNSAGTAEWFDFDNDGDLDIVIAGLYSCNTGEGYSSVLRNVGNDIFQSIKPDKGIFGHYTKSVDIEIADFNNDGRNDVFMYGDKKEGLSTTNLWLNETNDFSYFQIRSILRSSWVGAMDAADFDADGDIDVVIAGEENFSTQKVRVYSNNANQGWVEPNVAPSIPSNLTVAVNHKNVDLSWSESTDDLTPGNAIKYNVALIKEDSVIIHANQFGDFNSLVNKPSITLYNLGEGSYSWTVQSIDNSHTSSKFATSSEFTIETKIISGINKEPLFQVYPNPTLDYITINPSIAGKLYFDLIEINGRVVYSNTTVNSKIVLNLNGFKAGLYLLKGYNTKSSFTKRIIIQ
ncbi:MAG: VCBS repeat-containing protein [Cyclobacteriaceae bacterium]